MPHSSQVPHLFDLLAPLLDWEPDNRLGGDADGMEKLQADLYWGDADWEAVDARRMRSPLVDWVRRKAPLKPQGGRRQMERRPSVSEAAAFNAITQSFAASQKRQKAGGKAPTDPELDEREVELGVEGWEFVSEHAVAQEYVESAPAVVSLV